MDGQVEPTERQKGDDMPVELAQQAFVQPVDDDAVPNEAEMKMAGSDDEITPALADLEDATVTANGEAGHCCEEGYLVGGYPKADGPRNTEVKSSTP
jgi:hypothetical protein